jgi:hypothetical protein
MQAYQLHIISEQLRQRHPYLEPPFKARYDPTEVYKAVFDRAIPKLIEILLTEGLAADRYTNALITLNELASDEAEKSIKSSIQAT